MYVEFRISQVEVASFTSGGRRSLCMSGRDSLPSNVSVNRSILFLVKWVSPTAKQSKHQLSDSLKVRYASRNADGRRCDPHAGRRRAAHQSPPLG